MSGSISGFLRNKKVTKEKNLKDETKHDNKRANTTVD